MRRLLAPLSFMLACTLSWATTSAAADPLRPFEHEIRCFSEIRYYSGTAYWPGTRNGVPEAHAHLKVITSPDAEGLLAFRDTKTNLLHFYTAMGHWKYPSQDAEHHPGAKALLFEIRQTDGKSVAVYQPEQDDVAWDNPGFAREQPRMSGGLDPSPAHRKALVNEILVLIRNVKDTHELRLKTWNDAGKPEHKGPKIDEPSETVLPAPGVKAFKPNTPSYRQGLVNCLEALKKSKQADLAPLKEAAAAELAKFPKRGAGS